MSDAARSSGPGVFTALRLMVRRSLRQHALSTCVTVLVAALGGGLTIAVFAIADQTERAFVGGSVGFDAVLGSRGSPLQLVLNSVFHLDTSPGNIPWSLYQEVRADPAVKRAIPYAVGDNYHGYRVVGTTSERFECLLSPDEMPVGLRSGRLFDDTRMEAVVGSVVAERMGVRVNDHIHAYHDLVFSARHEHDEEYVVVGILEPSNSPADRVVWVPIESVFRLGGHVLRGGGEEFHAHAGEAIPDEHKEVSAVMLAFTTPTSGLRLAQQINGTDSGATIAFPIAEVLARFFSQMGWIARVLRMVAFLVMAVAGAAILAAIHNTINERRREFAILRALGARRRIVFGAIVLESTVIAGLGAMLSFGVYAAILAAATAAIRQQTGVVLDVWTLNHAMWAAPLGMTAIGAAAGVIPAIKAYSTDVATYLSPTS
jgi:putative ABC transport system permease protein